MYSMILKLFRCTQKLHKRGKYLGRPNYFWRLKKKNGGVTFYFLPFCLDKFVFFSKHYQITIMTSSSRINSCQIFHLLANSDIMIQRTSQKGLNKDPPL